MALQGFHNSLCNRLFIIINFNKLDIDTASSISGSYARPPQTVFRDQRMLSLLARLVGWEQETLSKDVIDIDEIKYQLSSEYEWEEKIHYGIVTESGRQNSLVDGEFWMAGHSVGRIGGGEARVGDRVCVKLKRKKEGEGQWVVKELLQVLRGENNWDEEPEEEDTSSTEIVCQSISDQTTTKICCPVVSVRGVRVEVKMSANLVKGFSLSEDWKSSVRPVRGDLVQITLALASDDLEELEGSVVIAAQPARVLKSDGCITCWDSKKRQGLARGDVFISEAACAHGYRPRVGDSVTMVGVECTPSTQVWGCGWRAARVTLREGRNGRNIDSCYAQTGTPDSKMLIRGQSKVSRSKPNFHGLKLAEYPVPPSLCDPYITSPAIFYPQLADPLSSTNYVSKLHILLHLESVSAQHSMDRYTMLDQALTRSGPYLALTVPGLVDGAPGLVQGDSAILSTPGEGGTQYEGCIHEVRGDAIMLKFSSQFHVFYCGETYNVSFLLSRTLVRRQHRALEMAETQLGYEVIFPSSIVVKEAQVNVIDSQKFVIRSPRNIQISRHRETGKPFHKFKNLVGSNEDDMSDKVKSVIKVREDDNHNEARQLSPDLKSKIMQKLSTPKSEVPHPIVNLRKPSCSGPDKLRRKALLSSLPSSRVDTASPLWSVPSSHLIRPSSLPSEVLSFLPNSFSLPTSRMLPPYYPLPPQPATISWVNKNLNPEQRKAVLNILSGLARPLPYILYGPPGTGKTVTLVEAILQTFLLREDSRLLVCTPSNSSADLVTSRLVESGKMVFGDLARLNAFQRNITSVPEDILPYCFLPEEEEEQLSSAARHRIVVTTCSTAGTLYKLGLSSTHFTHVFIDEAGHLTEPEVLIPSCLLHSSTGQIVLAGDPQQLGPTIISSMANMYGLGQSMLERLANRPLYLRDEIKYGEHGGYDPRVLTKLVRNYRSHEDILSIPSKLFYESELIACAGDNIKNRFCGDTLGTLLPNKDHPIIFHGVHGESCKEEGSSSWHNPQEVWQVVTYVKRLEEMRVLPEEIGIIAPYRAQCRRIKDMLSSLGVASSGLKVGSVEEFQGQERPVIILTTVRSSMGYVREGDLGFLTSEKRLNVSITRAQSLLVVVGDPDLLCTHPVWREFLISIVALGGFTGVDLPSCLVTSSE